MHRNNHRRLYLIIAMLGFLVACGDNSESLNDYINKVKSRNAGQIEPLPVPVPYKQYAYPKKQNRDPFVKVVERSSNPGKPDLNRPKQPLEAFAIDSLRMVGTVDQDGQLQAVIAAPDGVVYRVGQGGFIGQNFGQITSVNEKEISVEESVENNGTWEKRPVKLTLVEGEA